MKKIALVLLAVVMAMTLAACGKFTCDACQQEKSGKKNTVEVLGQKMTVCSDCYKGYEAAQDALKDAASGLEDLASALQ